MKKSHKINHNSYHDNNNEDLSSIIRIFVSFALIVISSIAIYIVVMRVMSIKVFEKINLKAETHNGQSVITDTNSGYSFFVNDEKGLKFRKEDKTFAREEWVEKNAELFYFDTAGYGLNGDLKKDGQVYTFENGKLKNIQRDTSYVSRAKDELFSSIESAQYLVWLDDSEKKGNFFPIKYKEYSDDFEDYLGTEADKQYSSPNMIKIYMSNIYYLAVGKGTNFAGRLYRMRPNAIHKESVGIGVTGYIVLSDDIVYFCDGEKVIKAKNWTGINLKLPDDEELTEDGEIIHKVSTNSDATPIVNEQGKKFTGDLNNMPKPDEEIRIVETSVDNSRLSVLPKINETLNNTRESSAIRETSDNRSGGGPKVEIGLSPGETRKNNTKSSDVEIGSGPRVVEVEAPR